MAVDQASGKLTMLRVHDPGTGFGGLEVEVVVKLDSQPDKAFGFQLRNDDKRPARQGMLDLLRDAFKNNWIATIEYDNGDLGKDNLVLFRVILTK